jgi:uncharacterized protein YqgC (DUF456 family)
MIWLLYILLLLTCLTGLLLVLLMLPGLFLMAAASGVYTLLTRAHYLGIRTLLMILLLAVIAELLEMSLGGLVTRRAGGSAGAITGATIGGIAGGIFLTFIPIPIIGTIVGICLGTFLGAAGVELLAGRAKTHSIGVGVAAVKGRIGGVIAKLMIGTAMLLLILWAAWP